MKGGKRNNAGRRSTWAFPAGTGTQAVKLPVPVIDALEKLKKKLTGQEIIGLLEKVTHSDNTVTYSEAAQDLELYKFGLNALKAAIATSAKPENRIGRKVFLKPVAIAAAVDWPDFQAAVLECCRRGLLELARCDLPPDDPTIMQASEIHGGMAVFHCLVLPGLPEHETPKRRIKVDRAAQLAKLRK